MYVGNDRSILDRNSRTFNERKTELETINREEEHTHEESKKNRNFVMMYRDHMPEMRWLISKNGKAANLLNFIMEHMDSRNALMCSYQVFIDYFGWSKPTITRCIKLLYDNGFLDILKSGTSNVYIINHEVAWNSWHTDKKYSKFDGKILISATENKDYHYRKQFERFKRLKERNSTTEATEEHPSQIQIGEDEAAND